MKRVIVGLMLLLTACSETSLTRRETAEIKRIGVISAIGDELTIRNFAGRPAEQTADHGSIAELGLDPYVIAQVAAQLQGRYEIVPVTYQPAVFHQTAEEQSLHSTLIQGQPIGLVIRNQTQLPSGMDAGTGAGVDAYLVILTGRALLAASNQSLFGTSLVRLPTASGDDYNLGVIYWIAVVDGHSLQPIGNVSTLSDHSVDRSLWAPTVAALSEAQKQQIAQVWKKRIDLTLEPALKKLGFQQ